MSTTDWNFYSNYKEYGDVFYKRAVGELEEMESSKALCHVLKTLYQQGMTVADIGCGGGHYLRSLRQRLDPDISYTGIDATEYYIHCAQKAFPEIAGQFRQGNIFSIPAHDREFDIVINNNVILHLPPPPSKAFAELLRIAKRHVVIRTVFGERNYVIKELRQTEEGCDNIEVPEEDLVTADAELKYFNFYNIYTERYIRAVIRRIAPAVHIEIIKDEMWEPFDNRGIAKATGTHVMDKLQVSGNIILDWRFIILTLP